jgi:formylglycine-generating enzyme required for sulfatase activity
MIYRSWTLMTRFASGEDGTDYSKKMAVEILASFLQEFPRICDGAFGRAAKRVAEQLLSEFRLIPPDPIDKSILKFEMGSPESEFGRGRNESIVESQIEAQFKLKCYLVTQEQYALFDPDHVPWQQRRKSKRRRPVVNVNWYDAWVYCRWMGEKYRLPLENEWEFACRAGTRTAYSFGKNFRLTHMRSGIADPRGLIPVGCMQPNPWGLFDMHGLTWEWCDSWYADDPKNAFHSHFLGEYRVAKGGAANTSALRGRSAERAFRDPSDGSGLICFRILLEVEKK